MNLQFYRCDVCHRLEEGRVLLTAGSCRCGGRRIKPVIATLVELVMYVIWHPSYLVKAVRGE